MFAESQQIAGITGGKDEKTGIVDITVLWFVPSLEEVLTVGDSHYWGVPLDRRQWRNWEADSNEMGFQVDLTYQGKDPDHDDEGDEGYRWDFETGFRQRPIETHPALQDWIAAGLCSLDQDNKVRWNLEAAGESGDLQLGLTQTGGADDERNPLFGEESYPDYFVTATRTGYEDSLSGVLEEFAGKVFDKLPGLDDDFSVDSKNWLGLAPQPASSGEGYQVKQAFQLSEVGGWKPGIHDLISSSGYRGGGLRTGSL